VPYDGMRNENYQEIGNFSLVITFRAFGRSGVPSQTFSRFRNQLMGRSERTKPGHKFPI